MTDPSGGPVDPGAPAELERERERRRLAEERSRALERDLIAAERRAKAAERRLARVIDLPPIRIAMAVRRRARDAAARVAAALPRLGRIPHAARYRVGRWWGRRTLRASEEDEARFLARVRTETPPAARASGPLVSIVVPNRNGEDLLRRLVPALEVTEYRPIELVLVDNGSTDGSVAYVESRAGSMSVKVVRNPGNAPYSAANDQGVDAATGELVLLLNNDVEAVHPSWLGHLVETVLAGDAVAAGARLVYPRRQGRRRAGEQHPDLSLQHRGVEFVLEGGLAVPRTLGAGEDPFGPDAIAVAEVPALTAACLLLKRATYLDVGGFSPGYDYGWEDMDLCLRLRARGGRLVHDGRAVLFHHESTTRARADRAAARARQERNRARFHDTWAARLYREVLMDALRGEGRWTRRRPRVRIEAGEAGPEVRRPSVGELGTALKALGWEVSAAQPDIVVSLDPALDPRTLVGDPVTVAWISSEVERWVGMPGFDGYDVVLGSSDDVRTRVEAASAKVVTAVVPAPPRDASALAGPLATAIRQAVLDWATARRFAIRIGPPNHEVAGQWGDTSFGLAVQRQLERAGHPARVEVLPEWMAAGDARADVTLHVFGRSHAPTRPGQVNVLWQISHPDLAEPALYERYDLAFVASEPFAARMAAQVRIPVIALPQATDPDRFHPAGDGPAHELLFVGNSRNVRRRILDDLLPTTHELAVYGAGWTPELLDLRYLAGTSIPNRELHRYYAAAKIVLSDHWSDMRDEGFIANRLYDVLASGGFVISDDVEGIEAAFDGAVVTYRTASELRELIDRWLPDAPGRRALAERGRRIVLERHTFAHRASVLLAHVRPLLEARPASIRRG